jgi:hypothetical protein
LDCKQDRHRSTPPTLVKVTPTKHRQYSFVITHTGGANTVTINVKVAKW